ncbi:NACHT domain-containing protein [Streptomyces sp. JL7001]|uniref:NACHT domain-containing protein n=1 Tax=Streptomyces sp. JL7001 TaxID=3445784 RepID=UPI003F7ABA8D
MAPEIITAALGALGKAAADPVKDSAMRRTTVIKLLKLVHLDPNKPPKDFESLYAYALIEELHGRARSVIQLFEDKYVQRAFKYSFETDDWSPVQEEVALAVERNRETQEFGHLGTDVERTLANFIAKFQELVSRSRDPHSTRLENKVDKLLDEVMRTRDAEEAHRLTEDPERAYATPAERLRDDTRIWFEAVRYSLDREWTPSRDSAALLVNVPTRRPGRFDRVVVLCVEGELGLHHLDLLDGLIEENRAAEGWGVAQLRVSEAARRRAADSEDRFSCFSFDELIDLEVDFEPYIAWLQSEVEKRMINERYVPLSCRKDEIDPANGEPLDVSNYHWQSGGLDRYVETWLTDPTKKHLSLLGEFGMGKSWFSMHFASKLAEAWQDAKSRGLPRPRIPLVIPLRDYAKQTSVAGLLSEFFFNKHKIGLRHYDVFTVLNRMGRLLLIFDGFDEMASRIDRNTMVANFWELARVAEPGAKVLLSSRTEHFPEAKEARDLLEARVSASSTGIPSDGPTFEIVELLPFDDAQIEKMLGHLLGPEKVASVMSHDHVRDLMRRPVMSELVIDALPEIESGAPVNLTRIYLYAIRRKMDRDVTSNRTFTSRSDKLLFLSEISWEMLRANQLTLNYRDFPDRLRACFGSVVESAKDLDYWEQDMRNQGMLVRNAEGDYGPSHKSLLEFLAAYKHAAELGLLAGDFLGIIPRSGNSDAESYSWSEYFAHRRTDGSLPDINQIKPEAGTTLAENFGTDEFNPVVHDFLRGMIREHSNYEEVLIRHIQSTRHIADSRSLGGNCANLLGYTGGSLISADLEGVDLTGFRRGAIRLPKMSLRGANLRGAILKEVNLSEIDKRGADFSGASLKGARLLISARRITRATVHADGAISACIVEPSDDGDAAFTTTILSWADGDLSSDPVETKVSDTQDSPLGWWRGGVFAGPSGDWWGYSDGEQTFIVSRSTQTVIRQFDRPASDAIMWGDRVALVSSREPQPGGFNWSILDAETGEVIVTPGRVNEKGATAFSYFESHSTLRVWVKSDHQTKIFQYSAAQPEWSLLDELPVGVKASLSSEGHFAKILDGGEIIYTSGRAGEILKFKRSEVESALPRFFDCNHLAFNSDNTLAALVQDATMSLWHTGPGPWEQLWSVDLCAESWVPHISRETSRILLISESGEILAYSLLDGELLSVRSLNRHLAGAKISQASGLSEAELLCARRSGVIPGVD